MAKSVSLSQLRTDARLFADQRSSTFISDSELNRLINLRLGQLYDKLVAARGHEYYASESTISIVNGTARYNLPSDFYELLSITLEWGSQDHETLGDLGSLAHASDYRNWSIWSAWSPKAYRLRGAQIEIFPLPKSAVTARLQYIPVLTDLAADGSTFDGVNGWERLVALGAAIDCRTIEQNDYSDLLSLYNEELQRIEQMAADRNQEPKRVVETYPEAFTSRTAWWPRSGAP